MMIFATYAAVGYAHHYRFGPVAWVMQFHALERLQQCAVKLLPSTQS